MAVPLRNLSVTSPLARADVWPAHALGSSAQSVLATGESLLDAELPGGGWPVGVLIEILQPSGLHNEWRLLLPALLGCGAGPVVLVGAPYLPFAPALEALGLPPGRLLRVDAERSAERLWACEQALGCADVDAVLAWLPQAGHVHLRRLHMSAGGHSKLLFVMRPEAARQEASPAPLRLFVQLAPVADALQIELFKRRGPPLSVPLTLPLRTPGLRLLLALGETDALDRAVATA